VSRDISNQYLQDGIRFLEEEQDSKAFECFVKAVQSDPANANGWYWLEKVIKDPEKQKYCHDRAISLDPVIYLKDINTIEPFENHKPEPFENKPIPKEILPASSEKIDGITPEPLQAAQPPRTVPDQNRPQKGIRQEPSSGSEDGVFFPFIVSLLIGFLVMVIPVIFLVRSGFFDPLYSYLSPFLPAPSTVLTPTLSEFAPTMVASDQSLQITPTSNESINYTVLQEKINEAYKAYTDKDYVKVISNFNDALALDPDNAEIHARLGKTYYIHASSLHDYDEFTNYLTQSLEHYDQAIKIDPTQADYYIWRGIFFEFTGLNQIFRETREQYLIAAQQNLDLGIQLGSDELDISPRLTAIKRYQGNCDLSLQVSEQRNEVESTIDSREALALSYICLGNYQQALDSVQENSEFTPGYYAKLEALYALGRYDEALALLNQSIEKQPGFDGQRYYWKALIEYQQGLHDEAWTDLMTGEGNTWARTSIYFYLYARYFLSMDDMDNAKSMIQFAEASLGAEEGPVITNMINECMQEFEVGPIELDFPLEYPIIALPDIQTIQALVAAPKTPTSDIIYYPEGYTEAIEAAFEDGTMAMRLPPRTTRLVHFSFNEPLDITGFQDLTIQVQGDAEDYQSFSFAIFMPNGGWRFYYPAEGSKVISFPENYLFPDHDLYIALMNPGYDEAAFFYNFGITATVTLSDGTTRVVGYPIESEPIMSETP